MQEGVNLQQASEASPGFFETTSWKTVFQAREGDTAGGLALERLLRRYYTPIERIFQYQRRCSPDDARELTQEFIKECLRRDFLREVNPDRGRFRTFLRSCIEHFLADLHDKQAAAKRGSGVPPLSLQETDEDGLPLHDPAGPSVDPWVLIDQEWARQTVAAALSVLREECAEPPRLELYRELRDHLTGKMPLESAGAVASRLSLSESAVHVARHRLRLRFGELVVDEVKSNIGDDSDWREELRYLMSLLRV